MKNINKILGVVLVLAMLAGMIVMASPVPVAAGTNAWTQDTVPVVTAGTDTNIMTVAADGLTMYVWSQFITNLSATPTVFPYTQISVQSTNGFHGSSSVPVTFTTPYTINVATGGPGTTLTVTGIASSTVLNVQSTSAVLTIGQQVSGLSLPSAMVWKSTDGGRTWAPDGLLPPANPDTNYTPVQIVGIKCAPTLPQEMIAWDNNGNLYRSSNGSQTWFRMAQFNGTTPTMPGATTILSADIVNNNGIEILVGTNVGVANFIANNGIWKYTGGTGSANMGTGSGGTLWVNQAAYAVAFAPNYVSTQEILALTNTGAGTFLRTYVQKEASWDLEVRIGELRVGSNGNATSGSPITAITGADMAFASDFDFTTSTTNKVYVAINGNNNGFGSLYRVNGNNTSATKVYDTGVNLDVYSVDVAGTNASGTVIIGLAQPQLDFKGVWTAPVQTSTDAKTATSGASWTTSAKDPNGSLGMANVNYLAATQKLVVGTKGIGSAIYQANDTLFTSFNGIGMFEIPNMFTMEWGGPTFALSAAGPFAPPPGSWPISQTTWPGGILWQKNAAGQNELILMVAQQFSGAWGGQPTFSAGGGYTANGVILSPLNNIAGSPTDYSKKLIKSIDGGYTWFYVTTPVPTDNTITLFKYVNADTYWVGWTGYIRSNTGSPIALPGNVGSPKALSFPNAAPPPPPGSTAPATPPDTSVMLISCNGGTTIYTKDGGATWTVLGNIGQWAATAFGPKYLPVGSDKSIWVLDTGWEFYKWTLDVSTSWELQQLGPSGGMPWQVRATSSNGGTSADPSLNYNKAVGLKDFMPGRGAFAINTPGNTFGQWWRNMGTTGADWRPEMGSEWTATGARGTMGGGPLNYQGDGTYFYNPGVKLDPVTFGTVALPANGTTAGTVQQLTDTIAVPPTLMTPDKDAQVNSPVDFNFTSKYTGDAVCYELQVARDAAFLNPVIDICGTGTQKAQQSLQSGVKYYWRARINGAKGNALQITANGGNVLNAGLMSGWSEVRTLTVKTSGSTSNSIDSNVDAIFPSRGQTGVSTTPVLTWGIVSGATYNVQIASDSAFTNVVDMASALPVALWAPTKALDANKTYYWRVQAVSGGINSDWVAFAFTTGGTTAPGTTQAPPPPPVTTVAPAPPQTVVVPTPVVNVPAATVNVNVPTPGPTQAPSTPAYIWVIIVIGAVLVVAVVVLIVRTRRV